MTKALLAAGCLAALTPWVNAAEIDDVKAQMNKLQARIDQLESGQKAGTTGTTAGGTTYSLNGYVKLDAAQDIRGNQGRAADFTALPLRGTPEAERKNTTTFSARTSRLNFQTATPAEDATIKTRVEFDFFTSEGSETFTNSARPRLRHAYGQVGNWLAGQTWSTFMDLDSFPEFLEFSGPTGQTSIRQPQIRYTLPTGASSSVALAVENPQADARDAGGTVTAMDRGPDFAANWTTRGDWGHFALRGLVRPLRVDDGTGANQASTVGWAAGVGGTIKLGQTNTLYYQATYGKGAGRYIQDANPAAGFTPTPTELRAQESAGGFLGLTHGWGGTARSTIVAGATQNKNLEGFASAADFASLNERTRTVHTNYVWSPYKQVDVGVEYIWGQRKQEDGQKGDLSRLQASVMFSF